MSSQGSGAPAYGSVINFPNVYKESKAVRSARQKSDLMTFLKDRVWNLQCELQHPVLTQFVLKHPCKMSV